MSKKRILTPDFCVIGGGSGGLSFAAGAKQMGASVVLVEAAKMGGDCLNTGCVPSKALLAAAKMSKVFKTAKHFGWSVESTVDFKKVYQHVQQVIKEIAPHDSVDRFEKLGVKVVLSKGRFIDKRTIETKKYLIQAKRFVLATGSHPFVPPIPGLDAIKYYTNENIFNLKELPKKLVVIGGGPIGIELAQAFSHLGSQVVVLEAMKALPKDDQSLTKLLLEELKQDGIEILERVKILEVDKKGNVHCKIKGVERKIPSTHLLVATGRRANVDHLGLDKAKIEYTDMGIKVNKQLRTSNKRVYAIGDCIGGYQFTHAANYHAGIAIRNGIFGLRASVETRAIPWVTYTSPELAQVGFLKTDLDAKNIPYRVLEMGFEELDRAVAEKNTLGRVKVLVSPKGYVLGASILGNQAGELIYPWVMAIQNNLKVSSIAGSIAAYPTMQDITKRVAGSYYKERLFSTKMRKMVRFLMWWKR